MANEYFVGQMVEVSTEFKVGGVLTDPSTVTLVIMDPDRVQTTYTYALAQVTREALGKFLKNILGSAVGTWFYRWFSTGACTSAGEGFFTVKSYMD